MALPNLLCLLLNHRWKRERQRDIVIRTCRRCGKEDVVDRDMGESSGFGL
jgi:hypothetical protein